MCIAVLPLIAHCIVGILGSLYSVVWRGVKFPTSDFADE